MVLHANHEINEQSHTSRNPFLGIFPSIHLGIDIQGNKDIPILAKMSLNSQLHAYFAPNTSSLKLPCIFNQSNGDLQTMFSFPTVNGLWKSNTSTLETTSKDSLEKEARIKDTRDSETDPSLYFDIVMLLVAKEEPTLGIIRNWELVDEVTVKDLITSTMHTDQISSIDVINLRVIQLYLPDTFASLNPKDHIVLESKRMLFISYNNYWAIIRVEMNDPSQNGTINTTTKQATKTMEGHLSSPRSTKKNGTTNSESSKRASKQSLFVPSGRFFTTIASGTWKNRATNERVFVWCSPGEANKCVYRLISHQDGYLMECLQLDMINYQQKGTVTSKIGQHRVPLKGEVIAAQCLYLKRFSGERFFSILEKHPAGWYQIGTYREEDLHLGPWSVEFLPSQPTGLFYHRYDGLIYACNQSIQYIDPRVTPLLFNDNIIHILPLTYNQRLNAQSIIVKVRLFMIVTTSNIHLVELSHQISNPTTWCIIASCDFPHQLHVSGSNADTSSCLQSTIHSIQNGKLSVFMLDGIAEYLVHFNLVKMAITLEMNPSKNIVGSVKFLSTHQSKESPFFLLGNGTHLKRCIYGYELEMLTIPSEENIVNGEPKLFSLEYGTHSLIFFSDFHSTRVLFTKSMTPIALPALKKDLRSIYICSGGPDCFVQVTEDGVYLSSLTRGVVHSTWKPKEGFIQLACHHGRDRLLVANGKNLYQLTITNQSIEGTIIKVFSNQISSLTLHFHEGLKKFMAFVSFWIDNSIQIIDIRTKNELGIINLDTNIRSIHVLTSKEFVTAHLIVGLSNGVCTFVSVTLNEQSIVLIQRKHNIYLGKVLLTVSPIHTHKCLINGSKNIVVELDPLDDHLRILQVQTTNPYQIQNLIRISTAQFGKCFVALCRNSLCEGPYSIAIWQLQDEPSLHWKSKSQCLQAFSIQNWKSNTTQILSVSENYLQLFDAELAHIIDEFYLGEETITSACKCTISWTPVIDDESFMDEKIAPVIKDVIIVQSWARKNNASSILIRFFTIKKSKKLILDGVNVLGEGTSTLPLMSCGEFVITNLNNQFFLFKIEVDQNVGTLFSLIKLERLELRVPPGMQKGRLDIIDTFSALDMMLEEGYLWIAASTIRHGMVVWQLDIATNTLIVHACDALDRLENAPFQGEMFCCTIKFVSTTHLVIATFDGGLKLLSLQKNGKEPIALKFKDSDQVRQSLDKFVIREEKLRIEGELIQNTDVDSQEIVTNMPSHSIVNIAETFLNGAVTGIEFFNLTVGGNDPLVLLYTTNTGEVGTLTTIPSDLNDNIKWKEFKKEFRKESIVNVKQLVDSLKDKEGHQEVNWFTIYRDLIKRLTS